MRETVELFIAEFGVPELLLDLSVDDFTARRIAQSDYAGVITVWPQPDGPAFHPKIKQAIETALYGRDPWVDCTGVPLVIHMNVEDDSFEHGLDVEIFGLGLAAMLGGLPRVAVARYRNFTVEAPTNL